MVKEKTSFPALVGFVRRNGAARASWQGMEPMRPIPPTEQALISSSASNVDDFDLTICLKGGRKSGGC